MTTKDLTDDQSKVLNQWFQEEVKVYSIQVGNIFYHVEFEKSYIISWKTTHSWHKATLTKLPAPIWLPVFKAVWDRLNN